MVGHEDLVVRTLGPCRIDSPLAARLGFSRVVTNSVDATGERDFVSSFLHAAALTMVHISRMAEDFILFTSEEFGFFELADPTTGMDICGGGFGDRGTRGMMRAAEVARAPEPPPEAGHLREPADTAVPVPEDVLAVGDFKGAPLENPLGDGSSEETTDSDKD